VKNTSSLKLLLWGLSSLLPIIMSACSQISIGAHGANGHARGGAIVHFPLEIKSMPSEPGSYDVMLLSGQAVAVHDGNTIRVKLQDHIDQVRLIGIDAPELRQAPWGEHARDALKALVEGKPVTLETDATVRDETGRLLAHVYVDGLLINAEMIRLGHAILYTVPPNVAHIEQYKKAQEEARQGRRGVWNQANPLTVKPDCYRKQKKGRECDLPL
jgi:micrococcal nuclease